MVWSPQACVKTQIGRGVEQIRIPPELAKNGYINMILYLCAQRVYSALNLNLLTVRTHTNEMADKSECVHSSKNKKMNTIEGFQE